MTGGHCYFFEGEVDSADGIRKLARQLAKDGVDFFKVMSTGGRMTPGSNVTAAQFSQDELTALVEEARRLGRKVTAHGHGTAHADRRPVHERRPADEGTRADVEERPGDDGAANLREVTSGDAHVWDALVQHGADGALHGLHAGHLRLLHGLLAGALLLLHGLLPLHLHLQRDLGTHVEGAALRRGGGSDCEHEQTG